MIDLSKLLEASVELCELRKQCAQLAADNKFLAEEDSRLRAENATMRAHLANDAKRHEVPQPPPQLFWCSVPTCPGLSYSASERAHPCRR